MTIKRILAIIMIYLLATAGWIFLGGVLQSRSYDYSYRLSYDVANLWGQPIVQQPPRLSIDIPGTRQRRDILPSANDLHVDLKLEHRRKGLIWYPTYVVDFDAQYTIDNPQAINQNVRLHLPLPSAEATYDHFEYALDGQAKTIDIDPEDGLIQLIALAPEQSRTFRIRYRTRGMYSWEYALGGDAGRVQNLQLTMNTDFTDVDYPQSALSPMNVEITENKAVLNWQADDLITRQSIGVTLPEQLNPGPLSARMTFFAPVCLLFFFVLFAALSVITKTSIHPMHYLFVSAGFFAFHLLFAYMIDLGNVHIAFAASTLVSVGLVVYYLRNALGEGFSWRIAAAGQMFYLVLFSYSFFLNGKTGLTVTIGSILTLALLMKLTAKTDWTSVFASRRKKKKSKAPSVDGAQGEVTA